MATENNEIVFNATINGTAKVSQSLADLKKELKAAQSAALNGDGVAAKRVAELNQKLQDLNRVTKEAGSSGVEVLNSRFNLFKEGLANFDTSKIKAAFKGIGTAMAAIPIFLLIEGITKLIENWDEVVAWGKKFASGLRENKTEVEKLTIATEEQKVVTASLVSELTREISVMEAQGKSSSEILAKRKQMINAQMLEAIGQAQLNIAKIKEVQNNDSVTESYLRLAASKARDLGFTEQAIKMENMLSASKANSMGDNLKNLKENQELIKNLQNQSLVASIKAGKDEENHYKKRQADKKSAMDSDFAAALAEQEKQEAFRTAQLEKEKQADLKLQADRAKSLEDLKALQLKADQEQVALQVEQWNAEEKLAKDRIALKEKEEQGKLMITQQALNSSLALSDLVFTLRLNQTKKGSAEELKVRKQQFQVEKAFKVAQIVMDGIQGAMKAYAMNPLPSPIGVISASLQGAAAAAAAVKVAATKFDAGSSGSADTGGGGLSLSSNVGGGGNAPTTTNAPTTQPFTRLDESGRNQSMPTVKAYVVESEMTDSQKRVGRLTEQASF